MNDKDILFGNLEAVLSAEGEFAKKTVTLASSPGSVHFLKDAGFDVVNLANCRIYGRDLEGLILISINKCLTRIKNLGK